MSSKYILILNNNALVNSKRYYINMRWYKEHRRIKNGSKKAGIICTWTIEKVEMHAGKLLISKLKTSCLLRIKYLGNSK